MSAGFFVMRKVLGALLMCSLLVACNKDSKQDWGGMEHFDFEISGVVTDSNGNPIKGISVSAAGRSVKTDSRGNYSLEGSGGNETSLFVNFTDVDGSENGGRYSGASITVQLEYVKGAHGPYLGLFRNNNVNVTMQLLAIPMPDTDIPLI